jgi:Fe-S-cluster containining protein
MKNIRVTLTLHDGTRRDVTATMPDGHVSINELLPPLHNLFETIINIELEEVRVSCRKGCAACCDQLIPLSIAEVFYINNLYESLPADRQKQIKDRLDRIKKGLQEKRLSVDAQDIFRDRQFEIRYFGLHVPCPFLEENCCGIYAHRPFICREYNILSSPGYCSDPGNPNNQRVKPSMSPAVVLARYCSFLYQEPARPIPLFLFLDWAGSHQPYAALKISAPLFFEDVLNYIARHYRQKASRIGSVAWSCDPETSRGASRQEAGSLQHDIKPAQPQKLVTRHANAENIKAIFQMLFANQTALPDAARILEIGSGYGYLRYLLSLLQEPEWRKLSDAIIETEKSEDVVRSCLEAGRLIIRAGIEDLPGRFGMHFTPLILSMNVLDVFTKVHLREHFAAFKSVLRKNGFIMHIMSSAVHPAVFRDIADHWKGQCLLPYHHRGHVGVRAVSAGSGIYKRYAELPKNAEELSGLFIDDPGRYLEAAQRVSDWFGQSQEDSRIMQLDEFSVKKIVEAMNDSGFKVIIDREFTSRIWVRRTDVHREFTGFNTFESVLGTLFVNTVSPGKEDWVLEISTFHVLVGHLV